MKPMLLLLPLVIAACDPAAMRADIGERAAQSVVVNVLVNQYPRPQAETAAACVIQYASAAEVEGLARDMGTRAGTSTVGTIRAIGDRPGTRACLQAQALPPIAVVP